VDELGGVDAFEKWFQSSTTGITTSTKGSDNNDLKKKTKNDTLSLVRHNQFINGRGLEYLGPTNTKPADLIDEKGDYEGVDINALILNERTKVISLPRDLVLRSTVVEDKEELDSLADDWDAALAIKLLRECRLGTESRLYGYTSLLLRSASPTYFTTNTTPPSTAPDAIRNWTKPQLDRLTTSPRGQKLLSALLTQTSEWADKYKSLPRSTRSTYTQPQFIWAMEAVHSRAFKGNYGGGSDTLLTELSRKLIPLATLAFATSYYLSYNIDVPDWVAFGLFALASSPFFLDAELLLNYGFLENVDFDAIDTESIDNDEEKGEREPRDRVRKLLAETFVDRGPVQ